MLIFGLGTGNTYSLAELLNSLPEVSAVHQMHILPWEPDYDELDYNLTSLQILSNPFPCDVAYYYLNYVDRILELLPDTKFVALTSSEYPHWTGYNEKIHKLFLEHPDSIGVWQSEFALNSKNGKRSIEDFINL